MSMHPPPLPRSFRQAYPFKLGTTSFIYPDHYAPNVRMLGPYLDEIELLFFDSRYPGSIPDEPVIETLGTLAETFGITYNIHLPTDVSIADTDPEEQNLAVRTLRQVIRLTAPLSPSVSVFHIPADPQMTAAEVRQWQERAFTGVGRLMEQTGDCPLAVETLDYPVQWLDPVLSAFPLSLCLDMGHLFLNRFDIPAIVDQYWNSISIIHLHGVRDGKDHIALHHLTGDQARTAVSILRRFNGTVSIEVFSAKELLPSLDTLADWWKMLPDNR